VAFGVSIAALLFKLIIIPLKEYYPFLISFHTMIRGLITAVLCATAAGATLGVASKRASHVLKQSDEALMTTLRDDVVYVPITYNGPTYNDNIVGSMISAFKYYYVVVPGGLPSFRIQLVSSSKLALLRGGYESKSVRMKSIYRQHSIHRLVTRMWLLAPQTT
jgi:hypothetical protein